MSKTIETPSRNTSGVAAPSGRITTTLVTALVPMIWGSTYLVTTMLLPPDSPLFAGLMRALPAGILGLLIARQLPRGGWWWKAAILGTLNIGLFFPLLFIAAGRLPGGVAATLGAAQPILVIGLAAFILSERVRAWNLSWAIVGVVGVGLVVLGPGAGFDALGIAAGIAGAASMGLGVILTKRWGKPAGVSGISFASWQLAAGGLVLLVPTLVFEGVPAEFGPGAWLGYAWLGIIGGLVAYTLWFRGVGRLPVGATALLGLLSPLTAAGLGIAFAGESLNPIQLTGFALALVAMAAGQMSPRSKTLRAKNR